MIYLKENHVEIQSVIFDLGNVLLDYAPRRFMAEMGIAPKYFDRLLKVFPESKEWQELDMGLISDDDFLQAALYKEPLLRREIILYHKHWYDYFKAIPENVAAFYQVKETGARTYVLSNFQKTCFRVMQEHNVFLDDFDGRVISFECHLRKPQPEIYELLISRYQLDSAHSVFIDDMEVNVQAAKAAGLQTIHLPIGGFVLNYLEIVN
ncbi:MAG: HAD family phosphatase [Anaerolineaceae bacterium]|nr:HAD family phosphatase [Anaerolineaceae bacterium]MBQ6343880.1 HAD family phosphatase [Anaerolineaceae bacterium]